MTKVTLIFPPATDPRGPHLALPSLTAWLRQCGIEVVQLDLDIEGLHALLRTDRLDEAIQRLRSGVGTHVDPGLRTALLRLSEGLAERVKDALATIHDPLGFFNANDFNAARDTLDTAVAVISSAAPVMLSYSLDPIRYDVHGYNPQRLRDLLQVSASPQSNLFHDFWEEEVLPRVDAGNPALVGISLANRQQLVPGLCLARRLKERGHFVVLGGTLISKFADDLARRPELFEVFADGVVVFEGETALMELIGQLEGGRDFSRVPNFRYLEKGVVHATTTHVEDVDALPTPDFAGLPLGDYLVPHPVLPVLSGKSCYYSRCRFCDIPHINRVSRRRYRRRSPEKVVADVRRLEERFGARHFVITDESLSPESLCTLAEAFGPDLGRYSFTGYARLEPGFTPDACRRIAAMGMRKLFFGLESAAQRTLDHMHKGTRVSAVPSILRACREAGIDFHLFSMIGLPEEDEASARETLAFFLDQREVIDHPGNSFDIHRFGLDVRARYFADREQLGLHVDPEALRRELVLSLTPDEWRNTRGLSQERIGELLEEFNFELGRAYVRHHNGPRPIWPPFEEHSVLYGDHFRKRPFPYATMLPVDGKGARCFLRLSPACVRQGSGRVVTVTSYWSTADLPAPLYRSFADPRARTVRELVSECVAARPDQLAHAEPVVRELVMDLVGKGLLQIELADEDVCAPITLPGPAGASP